MNGDYHDILVGWLIDGSGGPARKNQVLRVRDGIISSLTSFQAGDRPVPELVTDLSHAVVVPPLIDAHVHLCLSGTIDQNFRKEQQDADCDHLRPVVQEHLRQLFSHGVLAVRDGGDRLGCLLDYPQEQIGERVLVRRAGRAYYRQGRYGRLIGGRPVAGERLVVAYEQDRQPVDQVKVVNSGLNSLTDFGRQTQPQFSGTELGELVRLAHAHGRTVMVHANGCQPVREAVLAGCDSVEHGYFMGRENLVLMADRGTFWVPTVYTMKAYGEVAEQQPERADRTVVQRTLEHQLEQLALARQLGVRVALGTDAGSTGVLHGEAVVEEVKLLMRAGYRLEEALGCATAVNASLLGLDRQWGRIAPGRPAHFLVTRGTPAQLPRKLSYLEAIYRFGRPDPAYRR